MGSSQSVLQAPESVKSAHGQHTQVLQVPVLSKSPAESLSGACEREKACFISQPQVASTHSPVMTEQVASTKKRKKIPKINLRIWGN